MRAASRAEVSKLREHGGDAGDGAFFYANQWQK